MRYLIIVVLVFSFAVSQASEFERLEEQGLSDQLLENKSNISQFLFHDRILLDSLPNEDVLLIPNSSDNSIGMYSPVDGTFLGWFIEAYAPFYTPICAIAGPDDKIYISDQFEDAIFVFDRQGNYVQTYADGTDGLNNIRGIDFRDGHLFVTSGDDYIAEFDGPHSRLPDFVNDGSDPFDILFLEDGRALVADIQGSTDNVRLYGADGVLEQQLFSIDFPEQIQFDLPSAVGDYLNASFTGDQISDFHIDGTIVLSTPWDSGRGVYRLENGNYLATSSAGVFEIDPSSGAEIEQENTGSSRFIELIEPTGTVGIDENDLENPSLIKISQNYPNPFNAITTIKYSLSEASYVLIKIYDILGSEVEAFDIKSRQAGTHQIKWNAGNLPSGNYFYRIQVGDHIETNKMILLK